MKNKDQNVATGNYNADSELGPNAFRMMGDHGSGLRKRYSFRSYPICHISP